MCSRCELFIDVIAQNFLPVWGLPFHFSLWLSNVTVQGRECGLFSVVLDVFTFSSLPESAWPALTLARVSDLLRSPE